MHDGHIRSVRCSASLRVDITGGFTDVPSINAYLGVVTHINVAIFPRVSLSVAATELKEFHATQVRAVGDAKKLLTKIGESKFLTALRMAMGYDDRYSGVSVEIESPVPAGSGLGSSGSIMVAASLAGSVWRGEDASPRKAAVVAVQCARQTGIAGGQQDECAAALGGARIYRFADGNWMSDDVVDPAVLRRLASRLLLVRTAVSGRTVDIVGDVVSSFNARSRGVVKALSGLAVQATNIESCVIEDRLELLPSLFREVVLHQQQLHPAMMDSGARSLFEDLLCDVPSAGYKLTGGGGAGGSMLVTAPEGAIQDCKAFLESRGARVEYVVPSGCVTHASESKMLMESVS